MILRITISSAGHDAGSKNSVETNIHARILGLVLHLIIFTYLKGITYGGDSYGTRRLQEAPVLQYRCN